MGVTAAERDEFEGSSDEEGGEEEFPLSLADDDEEADEEAGDDTMEVDGADSNLPPKDPNGTRLLYYSDTVLFILGLTRRSLQPPVNPTNSKRRCSVKDKPPNHSPISSLKPRSSGH